MKKIVIRVERNSVHSRHIVDEILYNDVSVRRVTHTGNAHL